MSSEKHFSLPERQKYFPTSSPPTTLPTPLYGQLLDRFGLSRSGPIRRGAAGHRCFFLAGVSCRCHDGAIQISETHKLTWLQSCQPWSYRRLVAYSFLGLARGHRVILETRYRSTQNRLTSGWILSRQQPHCTVQDGFAHLVACMMAAEAYTSGKKQYWDTATETIVDR